jgi:uncharacterized protein (DUF2126 family)
LEHYLHLVAAIEHTASNLGIPVVLEGYEPPADRRLQKILVTPDPGVIEVNIHPSSNWDELVSNTTTLYDEAREARLGTEKFDLDGSHTGTGGGNHVTIGGATPADSPLLRRPDLLRSMITYWQHHPVAELSVLGPFIGPPARRPGSTRAGRHPLRAGDRVRGARPSRATTHRRGWSIVILRHLLVDLTGQHPPRRVLHRQAVQPDARTRAARDPGTARLRDAAPSADGVGAGVAGALRSWPASGRHALSGQAGPVGNRSLRPVPPALVRPCRHATDVIDDLVVHGLDLERLVDGALQFEFRFPLIGEIERTTCA